MLNWSGQCLYRFPDNSKQYAVNSKQYAVCSKEKRLHTSYCLLPTKKGSILIVVLWSLFFLSMLAIAVNAYIRPQLSLAGKLKDRAKMHYLAKAGVKRAILEIERDITDSYDALNDLWSNNEEAFKEIELGEGMFSVRYQTQNSKPITQNLTRYGLVDEERKININRASYAVLKQFFEMVGGCTSQQADEIAASIIDWRDEDSEPQENGAESGYYLALSPGYSCKNKDFEILEELLLVKGVTEEIFNKVKDRITVYGTGAVNINTADKLVLRSLGMSKDLAEKIIHFREGGDGEEATKDDNIFENTNIIAQVLNAAENLSEDEISQINNIIHNGLVCVRSDNFMGESFGKINGRENSAKIIFIFNRNGNIKYWSEE